jgi:hypothetical protein
MEFIQGSRDREKERQTEREREREREREYECSRETWPERIRASVLIRKWLL